MSRAFLSLYLVIVVCLATVGWGLDRLWEAYETRSPGILQGEALITVVEIAARNQTAAQTGKMLETIRANSTARIEMLSLDDISSSALADRIRRGELVAFRDANNRNLLYRRVQGQARVLVVEQATAFGQAPWLEMLFAAIFYLAIAIAVFFWIWPLSRDLAKLEKQAETLGSADMDGRVALNPRSTAFRLGRAFNRMADRIKELLDAQRDMTNAVSHELRTPLARMKFALAMASESKSIDEAVNRMDSIRRDVLEMDELVNQLLNYARLEQTSPKLDWKSGDMTNLIYELISRTGDKDALQDGEVRERRIQVEDRARNDEFVCDWPLMERAVDNLLKNAVRHCRNLVKISLETGGNLQRVIVEDDGQGVPEAHREAIFHSFFRLRHAGEAQTAGFGLGLAITRRIARWHQGDVYVGDSPVGGARFMIQWPRPENVDKPVH